MINEIENESNDSDQQLDIGLSQTKKPNNRAKFEHKGLAISSQFPGGNLKAALFQQEFRMEGKTALVVEFWGNSDAQSDPLDKSWFYFGVTGIVEFAKMGYEEIIFRFKNANNLRKFIREKRFKPYVVVKEFGPSLQPQWQALYVSKINILQSQLIEAEFAYTIKQNVDQAFFAENLPYNLADLDRLHEGIGSYLNESKSSSVCYHREIIARSVDDHNVYMCTVTSKKNVASSEERQPQVQPISHGNRPFLLRNRPEIVITARVHPSETSSSFCLQGILQSLIKNSQFDLLLEFFIFRIIPMVNPDGVENGHYRLDNYLQNLNRYYGHSDQIKTPSIFSIENLITSLREKSKLFLFLDIHGHNSPKPAFIFGNFNLNIYQNLENRTFVKIMEVLSEGNFSSLGCEFSKKNMTVKQKYDEHSKEASARVFAFRGNSQEENNQAENKNYFFVEHSYTLEIHPYVISDPSIRKNLVKKASKQGSNSCKNLLKLSTSSKKSEMNLISNEPNEAEIVYQYKKIGEIFLVSILEIIGANNCSKLQENEDCLVIRKRNFKDLSKLLEFYDRTKRMKTKQINRDLFDRYYQKWNLIEVYRQYISNNSENELQRLKARSCPIHQFYEERVLKKEKEKAEELNSKKTKLMPKQRTIGNKNDNEEPDEEPEEKEKEKQERNTIQRSNGGKRTGNEEQKLKVLAAKQFEMMERIQVRESNKNSVNSNLSQYRKTINTQASQIEMLERKIRKLMFRHRTEVEIPETDQRLYYESSEKNREEEGTKARKVTINPKKAPKKSTNPNRLEPLHNLKRDKIFHIKTEEARNQLEFNDQNCATEQSSFNKRGSRLDGLQPRIQEFVRKLSQHKQDLNTIEYEKKEEEVNKIRSNGLSLNERKKMTRASHQYLKESHKVVVNDGGQEQVTLYYNHVIASEIKTEAKSNDEEDNGSLLKTRLTGYHKSVKSKLQNMEAVPSTGGDQEVQNIVKSFRVLAEGASGRQEDLIQRTKKLLPEKKRQYKTLDEPYLPIISEFDPFGGRKSKARAPDVPP